MCTVPDGLWGWRWSFFKRVLKSRSKLNWVKQQQNKTMMFFLLISFNLALLYSLYTFFFGGEIRILLLFQVVARSVTTTPLPSPPVDNPARTTNTSSSSSILSVSSASLNKSGKTCGGGTSSFPSSPSAAPPVATSPCEVKSMHAHSASHLANRACVHLGRLLEQETDGATSGGDTHAQVFIS